MAERPGHRAFPVEARLDALGVLPPTSAPRPSKGPLIWEDVVDDGRTAVFKLYPRRGAISWWREQRWRFRVEREYQGLARLSQSGVPCPEPLFWTYGRSAALGRYEVLATGKVQGASPLTDWIAREGGGSLDLAPLLAHVRRMHEAGVFHGALWIKNILVAPRPDGGHDYFVLDMPRAMVFRKSIVGTRMATVDLLDLFWWIADLQGPEPCRGLAHAYGLDEEGTERLLRRLACHNPTRFTRNRQRFEFSVRERLGG